MAGGVVLLFVRFRSGFFGWRREIEWRNLPGFRGSRLSRFQYLVEFLNERIQTHRVFFAGQQSEKVVPVLLNQRQQLVQYFVLFRRIRIEKEFLMKLAQSFELRDSNLRKCPAWLSVRVHYRGVWTASIRGSL
jgi:hypothetical protein